MHDPIHHQKTGDFTVSVEEATFITGRSSGFVKSLADTGQIAVHKTGGGWFFRRADLERAVQAGYSVNEDPMEAKDREITLLRNEIAGRDSVIKSLETQAEQSAENHGKMAAEIRRLRDERDEAVGYVRELTGAVLQDGVPLPELAVKPGENIITAAVVPLDLSHLKSDG